MFCCKEAGNVGAAAMNEVQQVWWNGRHGCVERDGSFCGSDALYFVWWVMFDVGVGKKEGSVSSGRSY